MHTDKHPEYGDKYLRDQQYIFAVRSLFMVKKVLLTKCLSMLMFGQLMQRSQQLIGLMQSDQYVGK